MLVSILIVVEANEVSFGVHAGDPGKSGVGNVDGLKISARQQKTVKHGVAAEVGTHDPATIEDHGRERSCGAREVNQGEAAMAEEVTVPMQEIATDEFDSDHVAGIADAEAQRGGIGRIAAGKVDGHIHASAPHVGVGSASVTKRSHDVSARIDPGYVRGERCAGHVNGRKLPAAQNEAVRSPIRADISSDDFARRCDCRAFGIVRARKIKRRETNTGLTRKVGRRQALVVLVPLFAGDSRGKKTVPCRVASHAIEARDLAEIVDPPSSGVL